ncbi:MAG: VgrG-related protein [Chloroflexota bacterium]|nr:VgrG-related protein [Chloroflexota bacterium]
MPKVSASWSRLDVKLAGNRISPDMERDLAEIEVENNLYLPDAFTLRFHLSSLDDKLFDLPDAELIGYLSQGSEVTIYETYEGSNNVIMDGEVTSVGLEFSDFVPSGQLMAVVQGYDRSHRLHRGRNTVTYNQMSYTDIVTRIARTANLQVDADATSGVPEYVIQSNQSDWEFLWQLANRVGYRLYVTGNTLYFKKGDSLPDPVAELKWGIDLAQFRYRSSLAFQDGTVIVRGWDPANKQAIVGQATTGSGMPDTQDSGSGTSRAEGAFGESRLLVADRPVRDQSEAQEMAQSLMDAIAGDFVQAEGVTNHGFSRIVPGECIKIQDLGKRSGTYFVTSTTHHYTSHEGYTTRFVIGGGRSGSLTEHFSGSDRSPGLSRIQGVVIGQVTNNNDPEDLSRVKVEFPWLDEQVESDWARVVAPGAGPERGLHWLPEVDDEVLVAFEHGDIHRPCVLGGLWSKPDAPPAKNSEVAGGNGTVTQRTLVSSEGLNLTISDEPGSLAIAMADKDGGNSITIKSDDKVIEILSGGDINISGAQGTITIEGQEVAIKSTANMTIEAGQKLEITAGTDLALKGNMNTSVEGGIQMNVKGTQTVVEGSAMTEVKAPMVKIN